MFFREITGQQTVKASLTAMVDANRLPHAMLLMGPPGCGKLALALALAQYLLCLNRTNGDACGSCSACIKASKYIHPDLHFSFPTVGSKMTSRNFLTQWRSALAVNPYLDINQWLEAIGAENKQGNITKDECVQIIQKLSLKTFESANKILLMWRPEYLGNEGNRLLKMIEEPPEGTVFILVAEQPDKILNTILSRCQLTKIQRLTDGDIVEGLVAKGKTDEETARKISFMADGNFNEALKLVGHSVNDEALLFLDWLRNCYKGNPGKLVSWVEEFAKIGREKQKHFLQYGLHFMREYLLLRMTGESKVRLQTKELQTAQRMIKVIGFEQLQAIVELFDNCIYYVERNANPKALFLDVSIRLHYILQNKMTHHNKTIAVG